MNKSIDAFRTISEVADDLDIPQHVLRFWETRFGSIRPLKRGGGRRYYRPDDVDLLKGIRQLLYGQGYTIKGVQRILKEDGPRFVQGVGRGDISGVPGPRDEDGPQAGTDLAAFETADGGAGASMTVRVAEPRSYPASSAADILPDAALDRLRAVLDDLIECQRVLESLRRG